MTPAVPLMLEARDATRYYRGGQVRALDGISLSVPAGSFVVLTGPSGSGKSTLLALLGALDRPTGGTVRFAGQDLTTYTDTGLARVRRQIGFVAQGFALIPGLSAWENVAYALIARGVPRAERRRVALDLLSRLGLGDRVTTRARDLSGGEQQRVAVARALGGSPAVVLADEPTSQLDEVTGDMVIDLLADAHRGGVTVLAASHDPRLAPRATASMSLAGGRLVAPSARD